MDKRALSERDICTKFITPSLVAAGWNVETQLREEVGFTDGRIYVRGKLHARGTQSRSGNVWDNAAMESFFSSLKSERTARKTYRSRDEATRLASSAPPVEIIRAFSGKPAYDAAMHALTGELYKAA